MEEVVEFGRFPGILFAIIVVLMVCMDVPAIIQLVITLVNRSEKNLRRLARFNLIKRYASTTQKEIFTCAIIYIACVTAALAFVLGLLF